MAVKSISLILIFTIGFLLLCVSALVENASAAIYAEVVSDTVPSDHYLSFRLELDAGQIIEANLVATSIVSFYFFDSFDFPNYQVTGSVSGYYSDMSDEFSNTLDESMTIDSEDVYYLVIENRGSSGIHVSGIISAFYTTTHDLSMSAIVMIASGAITYSFMVLALRPSKPSSADRISLPKGNVGFIDLRNQLHTLRKQQRYSESPIFEYLPIVPLILVIVGFLITMWQIIQMQLSGIMWSIGLGLFLSASIVLGMITYYLARKENDHFHRENRLRKRIILLIESLAVSQEQKNLISSNLVTMKMVDADSKNRDKWLSAGIIGFIVIAFFAQSAITEEFLAPFLSSGTFLASSAYLATLLIILMIDLLIAILLLVTLLFVIHLLMKRIKEHDSRWQSFAQETSFTLTRLGYRQSNIEIPPVLPKRSLVVYFVLTIVTASLFIFYWWYVMIKDSNQHMAFHKNFEKEIEKTIESIAHSDSANIGSQPGPIL